MEKAIALDSWRTGIAIDSWRNVTAIDSWRNVTAPRSRTRNAHQRFPYRTVIRTGGPNPPCSRPRWRGRELGASLDAWWLSMGVPTYDACQRGG
jgi:hypothetical protein